MSKLLKMGLCLMMVGVLLFGCGEKVEPDPETYVTEVLNAMAAGDIDATAAYMHPSIGSNRESMEGLSRYVTGHQIAKLEKQPNEEVAGFMGAVNTAPGQERGVYRVVLEDDTTFEVHYTFLEDEKGAGFTKFYFSFGT